MFVFLNNIGNCITNNTLIVLSIKNIILEETNTDIQYNSNIWIVMLCKILCNHILLSNFDLNMLRSVVAHTLPCLGFSATV